RGYHVVHGDRVLAYVVDPETGRSLAGPPAGADRIVCGYAHSNTPAQTDKALKLLARSIELQPDYVAAHGYAAWCYEQRYLRNGLDP
ncbi:hypothetical protein ACC754_40480, partial [Rhizobium johnstonii]